MQKNSSLHHRVKLRIRTLRRTALALSIINLVLIILHGLIGMPGPLGIFIMFGLVALLHSAHRQLEKKWTQRQAAARRMINALTDLSRIKENTSSRDLR